ncbi:hypothetical protein [Tardiphaga sp. 768_D3_N2_1]|uniref:hypothetical protein n=1 Tax=Tardiphaga sp. 768_D3_N2_1 TaxID=3240783 RepID=UPI003F8AEFF2
MQDELAAYARELEAGVTRISLRQKKLPALIADCGLRAADAGRFATVIDVEAAFAKFRG